MVLEIAEMSVTPGSETAFVDAHVGALPPLEEIEGMISLRLTQGVEDPTRFVLLIEWTDIPAHERFRGTDPYSKWLAAVVPFVAGPASVQHTHLVG
jgi:quinol monooxygenase YgiN